jgi:hypothetical protein
MVQTIVYTSQRDSTRTQPKLLGFPRPGRPVLPQSLRILLRGVIRGPIRHALLTNGTVSSEVDGLDQTRLVASFST